MKRFNTFYNPLTKSSSWSIESFLEDPNEPRYPYLKFMIMLDAKEFVANFEQKELVVVQFLETYVF